MLLGDCDFGQIEPRVLAHLSKDPALCNLFNDGIDFHTYTADRLGIDRDRAKILNLSVGYRATFKSVSAQLKCADSEARNEIENWWALFPHLRRWQDQLIFESKKSGICTTLLGRRIRIDNLDQTNKWEREAAERQVINNITQGSAAEIMKMAMLAIDSKAPNLGLLVQVYDSLLFEAPIEDANAMGFVVDCMKYSTALDIPLTVDSKSGPNWGDCI
jgi:DNA polymerase-1